MWILQEESGNPKTFTKPRRFSKRSKGFQTTKKGTKTVVFIPFSFCWKFILLLNRINNSFESFWVIHSQIGQHFSI